MEKLEVTFSCNTLGGTPTQVMRFDVEEELNRPHLAEVVIRVLDPDFEFETLLGQNTQLCLSRRPIERQFNGLISRVKLAAFDSAFLLLEVQIAPAFSLLQMKRNSQIFQEQSADQIIESVLKNALPAYDRTHSMELFGTYPTREYCVQYQESDFDFVNRLCEEEGIHYAFDHSGAVETLVLRDDNSQFSKVTSNSSLIIFEPTNAVVSDHEPMLSLEQEHRHTVTSVSLLELDWTQPGLKVKSEQKGSDAKGRSRESYEHGISGELKVYGYDQGLQRYTAHDGDNQAKRRLEAYQRDAVVSSGFSRVIGMQPGVVFELSGHPEVGFDGDYLVTRVVHSSEPAVTAQLPEGSRTEPYHNYVICIPAKTAYRPERRTPKTRIHGAQTALVTGPAGSETHCDDHGRIKVKFHWDRSDITDDKSSLYIRTQQPSGGAGWGHWILPRIGMEAIITFLDGDPDRPVYTGCLYNGENPTPFDKASLETGTALISKTQAGSGPASGSVGAAFADLDNGIVTHDVKGQQTFALTAAHDYTKTVGHDDTYNTANDRTETIGGTETRTVTGKVTETFKDGEERTVDGEHSETVKKNVTQTYNESMTQAVAENLTQTVGGKWTQTVTEGLTFTAEEMKFTTTKEGIEVTSPTEIVLTAPEVKVVSNNNKAELNYGSKAEINFAATSETFVGLKNENFVGIKIENSLAAKMETSFAISLETSMGVKIETDVGPHMHNYELKLGEGLCEVETVETKIDNAVTEVKDSVATVASCVTQVKSDVTKIDDAVTAIDNKVTEIGDVDVKIATSACNIMNNVLELHQ